MLHKMLAAAIVLLCISAGARADQDSTKPIADLLFTLSADTATFTTANTLVLQNASATALFYGKGARAGVTPTGLFANSTAGAQYVASNGQWLSNPTATLYGYDANNTGHAIVLSLASPSASPADKSVTFNVAILNNASAIETNKGVANEEFEASTNDAGYLLTSVQPGTEMYDVALFIDVNNESVQPEATTKDWYRPYYGGYNRGYGYGYGGGYGYGYRPYYRPYYGYGWGK